MLTFLIFSINFNEPLRREAGAASMFFISNIRRVFELMISITQVDIALFSIMVEQLVSICTVYFLVNEKQFKYNEVIKFSKIQREFT